MPSSMGDEDGRIHTVREILAQLLSEDSVSATVLLESLHYAAEPDLTSIMRAVAALDTGSRLQVLSYVLRLGEGVPDR